MSIDVRETDDDSWNRYVERSPTAGVFHRREALMVQARQAGCRIHRLVGFKGQEPVGIFPVFALRKGPVTTAFSPPPDLGVPYLGPALLNMEKLKQRKAERRQQSFFEACMEWVGRELNPRYTHVRVHGDYDDLRPLKWAGFDATPSYTYEVDLTPDREDIRMSFSSDARKNIRDGRENDRVTVTEGDRSDLPRILTQVRERYESQGITFHLSDGFGTALYDRLPDGVVRPVVCRVDGEFVGGILAYEDDDTVYRWQGGVRTDTDVDVAVNDVLDWAVMDAAKERGRSTYDLVGAENERINSYKAKFNPTLQEYYSLERASPAVSIAAHLYKQVRSSARLSLK
jgi:hypothetical protein